MMFEHLYLADYLACLIGILTLISFRFFVEGNKYETGKKTFQPGKFLLINIFDFIFYFVGGSAFLIVAGEVVEANPEIFQVIGMHSGGNYHWVISLGSGLFGSLILAFVLRKLIKK